MIFQVKRIRIKGCPIESKQLRKEPEIRGDIAIHQKSCVLGRSSVVATIKGAMPLETPEIHELLDTSIHSMAPNGFVLSGIEVIDGVAYAQSWLCRAD